MDDDPQALPGWGRDCPSLACVAQIAPERLQRMDEVLERRTYGVVPVVEGVSKHAAPAIDPGVDY